MKSALKSIFATEYKSLSDFFAVFFIIGILISFSGFNLSDYILIPTVIALAIFLIQRREQVFKPVILLLFMGLWGMGMVHYRTQNAIAPTLEKAFYNVEISGIVQDVSHLPDYQKITIKDIHFKNHLFAGTPRYLRLTYAKNKPFLETGDTIRLTADIWPPHRPVFFGTYHEARTLSFEGIGGIGKIHTILSVHPSPSSFKKRIEAMRDNISQRLHSVLPDEPARIAIPLTIGDQHVVTKDLYDRFRSAGIVHILSISGFHLSLLAAFVFFVVRGILSLCPGLAEHLSPKKIAAILALIAVMGYILISGMQIPAIRSFIMIAFVLTAVLFDRTAFSVRSLSVAAVIILYYRPEFIFNIGFQLSFTSVLILITLYQAFEQHFLNKFKSSFIGKLIRVILGISLAGLFITGATTPLVLYHFNQYAPYGILGNILTSLILSFWIMPCLFVGLLLMPLGADAFCLKAAGMGISYITAICDKIYHWPHAFITVPAFTSTALYLMISGIVLVCLMKTKARFIGILVFLVGIGYAFYTPKPDILIGDRGQTVAVQGREGKLQFLSARKNSQTVPIWQIKNGEKPHAINAAKAPPSLIRIRGKRISLTAETCPTADLCMHALMKDQTYLIYIGNQIKIKTP